MIRNFEKLHGAVLMKVIRGNPRALNLVETTAEDWSSYKLNDAVNLVVICSNQTRLGRDGAASWQFVFSANQLRQLNGDQAGLPGYAVLVCGEQYTCLLEPAEINTLVDFGRAQDSITIKRPASKKPRLHVMDGNTVRFKVAQSRLDTWRVPGC